MKKTIFYSLIMISFTTLSLSCSSDDDDGNPNDNTEDINQIENNLETGSWRISNFMDSGQDETNDFNGYNFTFETNGTLTAMNDTTTYTGTWSVTNSSSSSSSNDIDFNIFFPVSQDNDFEDLNDDWDIVTSSATMIELIDISGGNGGTDNLTFVRN